MATNPPLVPGHPEYHQLTDQISSIIEAPVLKTPRKYWITLGITLSILGLLGAMLTYLVVTGIGVWGNNRPIGWAWDITNFVFWIGIGHAGTLISAILCLFKQKWRTAVNRSAEAMTIFAVICAGMFPGIHVGRIWMIWMVFPIPNFNDIWPNFRSPLLWDVFAVSTYMTVSLLFWYMGMIPDFATLRDRAAQRIKKLGDAAQELPFIGVRIDAIRFYVYGLLACGWR
jgi:molybdopterin-containing oxidoreductase family membrane subunit